jgi:hypothetical protein
VGRQEVIDVPDEIAALVILLFAETAIAAFSVAIPQTILLIRLIVERAVIAAYTLKTAGAFGSIGLVLAYRVAVFVDFTYFEQRILGPISARWGLELALSIILSIAINYVAALYHWTVTLGHGTIGTTEPGRWRASPPKADEAGSAP